MVVSDPVPFTDIAALLVSLVFLVVAAIYDLKMREVPDKIWVGYMLFGLAIILLRIYSDGPGAIYLMAISVALSVGVCWLMAHFNVFGGADAKALICLSLTVPLVPQGFRYEVVWFLAPLFPMIILALGYLLSFSMSLLFCIRNLFDYFRDGSSMFDGHHDEPLFKKTIAVVTGYRRKVEVVRNARFMYPLERITRSANGSHREFDLSFSISEEKDSSLSAFLEALPSVGNPSTVWVTPGLPMIVFFLLALIVVISVNL
jgi:preflagellin peptidase FlaK